MATDGVVEGHPKILVDLASAHRHRAGSVLEDTFVLLTKVLDHAIHDLLLAMTELAVIHMEAYHHLLAFDRLVGYAWIVRIDDELDVRQTLDELAILVQQTCKHCTV